MNSAALIVFIGISIAGSAYAQKKSNAPFVAPIENTVSTAATDALAKKGDAPNPGVIPQVQALASNSSSIDNCWLTVSKKYNIPTYLLFSIAMVESSLNANAKNTNTNGSVDHGYMQINDWWFPKLATYNIRPIDLNNPCVSIHVGAWILAQNFYQMGYNWNAIGAYNARDPYKRWVYAQKVYTMHDMLIKWSDMYHKAYLEKNGTSPAHVPKPPPAWITYAQTNAAYLIKTGGRASR